VSTVHHDPATLPADDNVNPYTFCVELKGSQWFLQKGKMIAYYGTIDFNGIGHGRLDRLVRTSFHSPLHARLGRRRGLGQDAPRRPGIRCEFL
jgi:hypothetical protein